MERINHTEGRDLPLMARPVANGYLITRSEVSVASISVYERGNLTPVYGPAALALTADPPGAAYDECMFAAEQTGAPWPKAGGMTFYYVLKDTTFHLDGGKAYKVVVSLTAGHDAIAFPQLTEYGLVPLEFDVAVRSVAGV